MPLWAKPIKPDMRDVMIPLFYLSYFEIVGNIKANSFIIIAILTQ